MNFDPDDKQHTLCFTGHRPSIVDSMEYSYFADPSQYDSKHEVWEQISKQIRNTVLLDTIQMFYIDYGIRQFITGGAIGFDQLATDTLIDFKRTFAPDICIVVARPFPSQPRLWPAHVKELYYEQLNNVDEVIDVNTDPYEKWKMHVRNKWMVDHSSFVISMRVAHATTGGTVACMSYAMKQNIPIWNIDPVDGSSGFIGEV